ncbi:MAG: hypothetical protein U0X20_27535 [Caldilineaceae bacterium]
MTTETTTDKPQILDRAQLRTAVLDLLERANAALDVRPDTTTAGDYAARLTGLVDELADTSYLLANALPALRILWQAAQRVDYRRDAVCDVFNLGKPAEWTFTSNLGERVFLRDVNPVFPALGIDYVNMIDEDVPF